MVKDWAILLLWPGQVGAEDRRLMLQLDSPKNLRGPCAAKTVGFFEKVFDIVILFVVFLYVVASVY